MLLDEIKNQRVEALKTKNNATYKILTLILGELSRLDNKSPSDEEVEKVIKKMVKSSTETNNLKPSEELLFEIQVLKSFLKSELTEQELSDIIDKLIVSHETLPLIMKELKAKYAGQYDGKIAKDIILLKVNYPTLKGEACKTCL